jgi:hypothetical protein
VSAFFTLDVLLKGFRHDTIRNHPHFVSLMTSLPFVIISSMYVQRDGLVDCGVMLLCAGICGDGDGGGGFSMR